MMTDPIADMLTRIRNANRIERPAVDMPATHLKQKSCKCSRKKASSWITRSARWSPTNRASLAFSSPPVAGQAKTVLRVYLKYGPEGERVIRQHPACQPAGSPSIPPACSAKAGPRRPGHCHPEHQPRRDERSQGASPAARAANCCAQFGKGSMSSCRVSASSRCLTLPG